MKKMNNLINLSKTTLLIPLFALTLHSCKNKETGIVKDKIENKVYLTPVNDTANVYRVINFDKGVQDHRTENLYLNMNVGDTIEYYNASGNTEIIAAYNYEAGGIISRRTDTGYNILTINGVGRRDLPNLVAKQKEAEAIKQLQLQYQKDLNQKSK